jgi:NAD(P)-dependent dehydrogenase (short-subunit alcohol dehydrogenase family)
MSKWTSDEIPNQSGRTAIVTGANSGLGLETTQALAARGAHVVLAVRDVGKGKQAAASIIRMSPDAALSVQELDLGSLQSIRSAANAIASEHPRIDLLINNAGVMYPPKQETSDGFELQFGTNHLGHFALTGLLFDRLSATPGSRVVTVSSVGHKIRAAIHFDDLQWQRSYHRVDAYGQSKLANLLFTYELQRRSTSAGVHTIAVAAHPGITRTDLYRHFPSVIAPVLKLTMQSASMGALPTLRAATDPSVLGGQYYGPDGFNQSRGYPKVVTSSDQSYDLDLQRRLWAVSEDLTGVTFQLDDSLTAGSSK